MKRSAAAGKWWGVLGVALVGSLVAPSSAQAQEFPEGPGKALIARICSKCHEAEIVLGQARTRDRWAQTVSDMIDVGAKATDEEVSVIVDYLAANFPKLKEGAKININTASAREIEIGLKFQASTAAAIVAYREKNGNLKSAADLLKVPGIDPKQVEEKKGSIEY